MLGVHTGGPHGLDHIGVLSLGLKVPLVVSEEETFRVAREFYPDLQVIYRDLSDLAPDFFAGHVVLTCSYRFAEEFAPVSDVRIVYCPHGNSDKILGAAWQDLSLVYGEHMRDHLAAQGIHYPMVTTGNYRGLYWKEHNNFLSEKLNTLIGKKLCNKRKTIFYAPTYDQETFPDAFRVVEEVATDFNLLIRWHPFLEELYPAEVEKLRYLCEKNDFVCDLSSFPVIYPILHRADFYLGDASSIGYDFLTFDKPLFFLGKLEGEIYSCGVVLSGHLGQAMSAFQDTEKLKMARNRLALRTFGKEKTFEQIKQEIQQALRQSKA